MPSRGISDLPHLHGRSLPQVFLFGFTIFLSAFLLFQIQPLISRSILPWFGSVSAVWSTSLLFFQTLLLGGYAFAHWISSRKNWQLGLYLALLVLSLLLLILSAVWWNSPLLPGDHWKPTNPYQPFIRIVLILLASVGLPYFLLSTTSPLLQSWFKYLSPESTPYRLYALSNLGSLLGLISYPFLFEPLFRLREQAWFWSGLYFIYIGFCGYLGMKVLATQTKNHERESTGNSSEKSSIKENRESSPFQKFLWVALTACTSIMLLSVTNQLTQEVAVIPFLWVLPLSIYLFSFIITFSGEKWYTPLPLISLLAIVTLGVGYVINTFTTTGMFYQILVLSLFLLFATLVCHGELYRLRPDANQLTSYYLYISLGGVIGGLFVNLLAPLIFKGYWELHLGILLCWLLILVLKFTNRSSALKSHWVRIITLLMVIVVGLSVYLLFQHIDKMMRGVVDMQRNFYGVYRVRSVGVGDPLMPAYSLNHGTTSHGFQFRDPEKRMIPTAYYGKQSGIGLALTHYRDILANDPTQRGMKVGLIGLGTGTLAAYGQDGDRYRFYEINPDIIDLALGEGEFFTYLSDSSAVSEIVPGDARISLEIELESGHPQAFDILIVDAFNSDAIPIHLLTVEAFELYQRHLKPEGVLALHISNRYLNLTPLVSSLADHHHLYTALIRNPRDDLAGSYPASWILLSKNQTFFQIPEILENTISPPNNNPNIQVWTDDYSNLVPLIKYEIFFQD